MAKKPIKIGTVVRLNSGGPPMTVVRFNDTHVAVIWVSGAMVQKATFPRECIRLEEK
jgi:uncharacterized protein YodC (DUF2158 family)